MTSTYVQLPKKKRGRPRKHALPVNVIEEIECEADLHIIMQLRKVISLKGARYVQFPDGKLHEVDVNDAVKAVSMYNRCQKPIEKEILQRKLAANYDSFIDTLCA